MSQPPSSPTDREIVARLLDRITSDASFRQQLLADPASAAGALLAGAGGADEDVAGYMRANCAARTCMTTCKGDSGTCGKGGTCGITNSNR